MRHFILCMIMVVFIAGGSSSCKQRHPPMQTRLTEILRIPSKQEKVDAVLCHSDSGSTTSKGTLLFIVPHGCQVNKTECAVLSMDYVKDLTMEWNGDKCLMVTYSNARIFHYTNFWQHKDVNSYKYIVEIILNPTTSKALPRKEIEF